MIRHTFLLGDARELERLEDGSVHLVVTSPPYPMIAMWDDVFSTMDPSIAEALSSEQGEVAFEKMHLQLDLAWRECVRVLVPGGFLCVNIGDATRTIGGRFRLYPNHARIILAAEALGLTNLPSVVWRKPTNAPTKFMGSGMLPTGAYITLEHEHILIFRKGLKRQDLDPGRRRQSAVFWEERNSWFSDLWNLTGIKQTIPRGRSAAFPVEVPFRLILMYSTVGDSVLDPFAGTGTTLATAAALGRRGIAVDNDPGAVTSAADTVPLHFASARKRAAQRLSEHAEYVAERGAEGFRHYNEELGVHVMTGQERELRLIDLPELRALGDGTFETDY